MKENSQQAPPSSVIASTNAMTVVTPRLAARSSVIARQRPKQCRSNLRLLRRADRAVPADQAAIRRLTDRRRPVGLLAMTVVCVLAVTSLFAYPQLSPLMQVLPERLDLFTDVLYYVREFYVAEFDLEYLIEGAVRGVVNTLDSYSEFLPPAVFRDVQIEAEGMFGGIGLALASGEAGLTVAQVLENTPAHRAQIAPGDRIVAVEGVDALSFDANGIVEQLRGRAGSRLKLTLYRPSEEQEYTVKLKRAVIHLQNIAEAKLLTPLVGYVKLVHFDERSGEELAEQVAQLKDQGAQALVLDLRGNPGGTLFAAQAVAELFLEQEALIAKTASRRAEDNLDIRARLREPDLTTPLAILVDRASASASEIVAGAVQDHARGLVIGEATFGKGSVQTVFPLQNGAALRLTTAEYFTPAGHPIDKIGITPDIVVDTPHPHLPPQGGKETSRATGITPSPLVGEGDLAKRRVAARSSRPERSAWGWGEGSDPFIHTAIEALGHQ